MDIDHINHDPFDNRACNLRACMLPLNNRNVRGREKRKHDLPKGVYRAGNRYEAKIMSGKVLHRLGRFSDPKEAHECYKAAAEKIHGEFACYERKGQPRLEAAPSVVTS